MCVVYSSPVSDPTEAIAIGDSFIPTFQCPHRVQRVVCFISSFFSSDSAERTDFGFSSSLYVIGINSESLFESTLLKRGPGCEVGDMTILLTAFVPKTYPLLPASILLNRTRGQWGPDDPELRDRAHFKPFALGGTNNHEDHDHPKYWTLDSFMDLHGHTFIDILKIDIEGGEFDALTVFLSAHAAAEGDVLPVGQLQLEIHAREGHENFEYFARWRRRASGRSGRSRT
ncbi:hypothetical protein EDB89DRAFT_2073377 [Lactarius sanguifluus]|nr:hypothetical protein EDB89DRAFT_2073377 [Lactarius sanguifluus]